ncbi:hypothetical protein ACQY0O_005373 [Thecaphora frezii]
MAGIDQTLRALLVALLLGAAAIPLVLTSTPQLDDHQQPLSARHPLPPPSKSQRMRRFATNATEQAACQQLAKATKKSQQSQVHFPLSLEYGSGKKHYMSSSEETPACVYAPTTPEDLALAIELVGKQRLRFAVSSGGHASNCGFSSTKGIHITLSGFDGVKVANDKSYVDVGGGNRWDSVYKRLEEQGSGVNVVGGRVPGVGVGGFITGGGGYSWLTNQYGLTADTLVQADLVLPNGTLATATETTNADVFWAIRGGGNQFGVVYNFRLKAVPQTPKVYGGTRIYTSDQVAALVQATYDFSENNKDPKAQVITTLNAIPMLGTGAILLAVYDGDPGHTNPFAAFDKVPYQALLGDLKTASFASVIGGIPSALEAGHRGLFHSVMFERYSKPILDQIANQTQYYSKQMVRHSGSLVSYDIEPFLKYRERTKEAAWPHSNDALPLNLYFSWDNAADDAFWLGAIKESARVLTQQAKDEGQKIDEFWLYPNYLVKDTPVEKIYGPNLDRLRSIKKELDPQGVMKQAGYFDF